MRKIAGGLCLLTTLAILLLASPLGANESAPFRRTVIAPKYDVSKEITLKGTVETLVRKPTAGMIRGAHLIVSTSQGSVDAHIGNYIIAAPDAPSFAAGEAVKLVGVMMEFDHQNVLIVRTIEMEDRTITVRNDHGFLVLPGSQLALKAVSTGGAR